VRVCIYERIRRLDDIVWHFVVRLNVVSVDSVFGCVGLVVAHVGNTTGNIRG
jgi:hypothetical protein